MEPVGSTLAEKTESTSCLRPGLDGTIDRYTRIVERQNAWFARLSRRILSEL